MGSRVRARTLETGAGRNCLSVGLRKAQNTFGLEPTRSRVLLVLFAPVFVLDSVAAGVVFGILFFAKLHMK